MNRAHRALEATQAEIRELLDRALVDRHGGEGDGRWLWIRDISETEGWVAYELEGDWDDAGLFRSDYSIGDDGEVTLGDAEEVRSETIYEPVREAVERFEGRVIESRGEDSEGNRIFHMQIIEYGESVNGRIYPETLMRESIRLYEGARAYDHHRTPEELTTSTTEGIVGYYRNVTAGARGLEGDLHLLPSAAHTAELLDASLELQRQGHPPLVGVSHDVYAEWRPVSRPDGGRGMEAAEIHSVNSVDVVAHPSAGGRATRMVAGGTGGTDPNREDQMTLRELLELLRGADSEERDRLLSEHSSVLDEHGISADDVTRMVTEPEEEPPGDGGDSGGNSGGGDPAGGDGDGGTQPAAGDRSEELVGAGATEATGFARSSTMGRLLVREAVEQAELGDEMVSVITDRLPERFTESQLNDTIALARDFRQEFERAGLAPRVAESTVGQESVERRTEALDQFFAGDHTNGYRSLKQAYRDFEGQNVGLADIEPEEVIGAILGNGYHSRRRQEAIRRDVESVDTSTFAQALGDSITRRMIQQYNFSPLQAWRRIISSRVPISDFREQKITRVGGYGPLPAVGEGAPYQALTTPGDEEEVYTITKKGGFEDWTLEAIANDDVRLIRETPTKLGRSAALTLFRFVFITLISDNPTLNSDSTALFAAGHNNTDSGSALSQTTLSTGRRKMRSQAQLSATEDVLGETLAPRFLLVPNELEEEAFKLTRSAVTVTSGEDATTPNIHAASNLEPIVIDHLTDANDWFLTADPEMAPTIEIGFFQGREEPELFVQDDPRVGSVFDADKVTWKIRHIYSGSVLDFRAFYRGQG